MKRPERLLKNARKLRQSSTDAELRLWRLLRNRALGGFKFRRQHLVGPYILDFYCPEVELAVEVDGGGHSSPEVKNYDQARSQLLEQHGIKVLRFWNHDVLLRPEIVAGQLLRELESRRVDPPSE